MLKELAEPRARLLMESEDLYKLHDRQVTVVYHRWQAAHDDLDDAKALVAELKGIQDVSYWEVRAATLAHLHAQFAIQLIEAQLCAVVARRHRVADERTHLWWPAVPAAKGSAGDEPDRPSDSLPNISDLARRRI